MPLTCHTEAGGRAYLRREGDSLAFARYDRRGARNDRRGARNDRRGARNDRRGARHDTRSVSHDGAGVGSRRWPIGVSHDGGRGGWGGRGRGNRGEKGGEGEGGGGVEVVGVAEGAAEVAAGEADEHHRRPRPEALALQREENLVYKILFFHRFVADSHLTVRKQAGCKPERLSRPRRRPYSSRTPRPRRGRHYRRCRRSSGRCSRPWG